MNECYVCQTLTDEQTSGNLQSEFAGLCLVQRLWFVCRVMHCKCVHRVVMSVILHKHIDMSGVMLTRHSSFFPRTLLFNALMLSSKE